MLRTDLRAQGDADLAAQILGEVEIRRALERIERDGVEDGARRQLLGTAMRLSADMAPDVHATVDACGRTLGLEASAETYVFPGPYFNAAAVRPERGRLLLLISSSLLESFDTDELRFVVGHELGHFLFEHHRLPVGVLLSGQFPVGAEVALRLFAWQRYAEISADRAGVQCAGGLAPASGALFKLASGLRGGRVRVLIEQFLAQVGDLRAEANQEMRRDAPPRPDWFSTHPFSPLRLRAAELFAASDAMAAGGSPRARLEEQVQELMTLMEPSYLQERSSVAEAMRRLLFAGGVAVAAATGEVEEHAIERLQRLLGPGSLPFDLKLDVIRGELPGRMREVKERVPPLRRAQVMRDLCVIAKADGRVNEAELQVLRSIAAGVEVDPALLTNTLEPGRSCAGAAAPASAT